MSVHHDEEVLQDALDRGGHVKAKESADDPVCVPVVELAKTSWKSTSVRTRSWAKKQKKTISELRTWYDESISPPGTTNPLGT